MRATTEKGHREKLRRSCRAVGTYKPEFEPLIRRLAEYYTRRDQLQKMFEESGSQPMIKQRRSGVMIKNPILDEKDRLMKSALDIERELGLTPAALRRVNEAAMAAKQEAADPLTAAILSFRQGA